MLSNSREEIGEVFNALDADMDRVCDLSFDALTTPERLGFLERLERVARRLPVAQHALLNQLAAQATDTELGGTLPMALANRLRLTPGDAHRRVAETAAPGERRALTAGPPPPLLFATPEAQPPRRLRGGPLRGVRRLFG